MFVHTLSDSRTPLLSFSQHFSQHISQHFSQHLSQCFVLAQCSPSRNAFVLATLSFSQCSCSCNALVRAKVHPHKALFSQTNHFILAVFTGLFSHSLKDSHIQTTIETSCHYCSNWIYMMFCNETRVSSIDSKGGSESCHRLWERHVVLSDTISLAQRAVSALTTPGALTARQSCQSCQSSRCPFPDVHSRGIPGSPAQYWWCACEWLQPAASGNVANGY